MSGHLLYSGHLPWSQVPRHLEYIIVLRTKSPEKGHPSIMAKISFPDDGRYRGVPLYYNNNNQLIIIVIIIVSYTIHQSKFNAEDNQAELNALREEMKALKLIISNK